MEFARRAMRASLSHQDINRRDAMKGGASIATLAAIGATVAAPTAVTTASVVATTTAAQAQRSGTTAVETRIGKLEFTHKYPGGYPTAETVEMLYDERDFQRAVQAYLWAMPAVSFWGPKRVLMEPKGAAYGDFTPFTTFAALSHFLTPNVTTPYTLSWFNLAETGPFVVEIPPGPTAGFVDDLWQRPVTDMGQPGPDKGKGGKFLVLGPEHSAPADAKDYITVKSPTNNNLLLIRLLSADAAENQTMQAKLRAYPYSQRANPPANKVIEPIPYPKSTVMGNHPRGIAYFETLAEIVNQEPVHERDRIMMGMLRSLGIEKGKPFKPADRLRKILAEATVVGEAMAKANDFEKRGMETAHYADGSHWHIALLLNPNQETPNYTQVDERAAWTYEASCTSEGMVTKTPGIGSVYLSTYKDKDGDWLDGAKTYRLRVPPNAPAAQFWSMTIYDVDTRSLIQNKEQVADRSSRQDLVKNADGSIDLYVGPTAPKGFEKNWVQSLPDQAWFSYFRLYGPTEAHFNRTWVLPDFEKVN
jgi:hypothetical protein